MTVSGTGNWKTLQSLKLTNGDYMIRINDTLIVTKFPYSPWRRWSWGRNFTLYTWDIDGKPTDTGHCSLQKVADGYFFTTYLTNTTLLLQNNISHVCNGPEN